MNGAYRHKAFSDLESKIQKISLQKSAGHVTEKVQISNFSKPI